MRISYESTQIGYTFFSDQSTPNILLILNLKNFLFVVVRNWIGERRISSRVVKAEAIGMTLASVKMARVDINATALESLVSELEIMSHIGRHLNVVILLGACTKNISQGTISWL